VILKQTENHIFVVFIIIHVSASFLMFLRVQSINYFSLFPCPLVHILDFSKQELKNTQDLYLHYLRIKDESKENMCGV
jgi:hypothetical protein